MSYYNHVVFLNANDPAFLAAKNGTPEEIEAWEDDNLGDISYRPGADVECREAVEDTNDEYGGHIIDLSKVPENVTHIVVYRS